MGIGRIWRPETFQGVHRKKRYFEGWYFKLIDRQRETMLAIIPGISIGESLADAHAFIQVIDAVKGKTEYYRFAFQDFHADKNKLLVTIGDNTFSDHGIKLNLRSESTALSGELRFTDIDPYPKTFFRPGIMGPFSFVPGMECYHGVVNIRHTINGSLNRNGTEVDMTGGEGYLEKDWGRSFPKAWIWVQANHFEEAGASFLFSVARIPWLGKSFTGLIAFMRTKNGFETFATYNGGRIRSIQLQENLLDVTLTNAKHTLHFTTSFSGGGILKAPKNGLMSREIEESITATTTLSLLKRNGEALFQGTSQQTGLEIAGGLKEILRG
ncbi:MAG: tocopherol cyclase family protein [Christensenella sp.]|nr:tocopherol cyclase family protein [Christensenella sp.]